MIAALTAHTKMEHAIYVQNMNALEENFSEKFQRVYFGTEFCERLIPPAEEIIKALEFCSKKNLKFTFVTPYCSGKGISAVKQAISLLPKDAEVVFNDWGLLEIINENGLTPVMGRLLVKIRRDTCIENDNPKIGFFRCSNLDAKSFQEFLAENKVERAELDNVKQGYSFKTNILKTSLYYPFVYMTTGRKCLFAGSKERKSNEKLKVCSCSMECRDYQLLTATKNTNKNIIVKGNTHFYFNDKKPNLKELNTDRIVFMPNLPF